MSVFLSCVLIILKVFFCVIRVQCDVCVLCVICAQCVAQVPFAICV